MKKEMQRSACLEGKAGKIILRLIIAVVVCCVTAGVALTWLAGHHLINTDQGLVVVSKRFVTLADTRVDIRGWSWEDAEAHAEVCKALIAGGYKDLLPAPPPEPTLTEKAVAQLKEWQEKTVEYSTNTWSKVKRSAAR